MAGRMKRPLTSKKNETENDAVGLVPSVLPVTRSKTATLSNYEVWRNELEKNQDINKICKRLDVSLETLSVITQSQQSSLSENPSSFLISESVANLLNEKSLEASVLSYRNVRVQQPKDGRMHKGDSFPMRSVNNDLSKKQKSDEGSPKQDLSNPKRPGESRSKLESNCGLPKVFPVALEQDYVWSNPESPYETRSKLVSNSDLPKIFPVDRQGSSSFVPSLSNECGDFTSRIPSKPSLSLIQKKSEKFGLFVGESRFYLRMLSHLHYSTFNHLVCELFLKTYCNLKDFIMYVYDII